jgi:hypothetical protein
MERGFVPIGDLERVQMEDGRQGIKFVKTGHDTAIFYIRKPADVNDEVRPAPFYGDFITGFFHVTIRKTLGFTDFA